MTNTLNSGRVACSYHQKRQYGKLFRQVSVVLTDLREINHVFRTFGTANFRAVRNGDILELTPEPGAAMFSLCSGTSTYVEWSQLMNDEQTFSSHATSVWIDHGRNKLMVSLERIRGNLTDPHYRRTEIRNRDALVELYLSDRDG